MTRPYQKDLKVDYNSDTKEKVSLSLSPTGDLQVIEGTEKLAEQIMRALVNDQSILLKTLNSKTVTARSLTTLFTLIMRSFKTNQATEVNRLDDSLSGFSIYRKAVGIDEGFTKISVENVIFKYEDTEVQNGVEYTYGIAKVYGNAYTSEFVDQFTVKPSKFQEDKKIQIGTETVVMPDDGIVTLYVDYNRRYRGSEIFDKVLSLNVVQDRNEPRRYIVNIYVQDYNGNKVALSTSSIDPTK